MARRATKEEKSSAISMYKEGVFITEIAKRTGFGTTTIFRWATEEGILKSFSERLSFCGNKRQFGREHVGKKGVFHTKKGNIWISTDSNWEQCRLLQLENDHNVTKILRCSYRVKYKLNGVERTYIPDFEIHLKDGSIIVEEIKPKRMTSFVQVIEKTKTALNYFESIGIKFKVITEYEIGLDVIKNFSPSGLSHQSEEYKEAFKEKRKAQKRKAQKTYYKKSRSNFTEKELSDFKKYHNIKQKEFRGRQSLLKTKQA